MMHPVFRFWRASYFILGSLATASSVQAQIVPDSTLPVNSLVTPGCTICKIDGGTNRGVNLFHSFSEFSVPTVGEAFFNNALRIQNIFSRVTGNSVSNIDGLLRTNGTASLFFLNPNGVIFGQNARLEIGGSFLATTANSFKFPNGSEFSATNPQAPPLLRMNITPGLQYGANQPQTTITNRGNLAVGQDLTLNAGNLDLQGQLVAGRDLTLQAQDTVQVRDSTTPFIASANGNLLLQGNQKVDIFALNHPNSGLFSGGNMVLRSANTVGGDAHYWSGGNFRIEKLDGSLGSLSSPYDPIILANGDISFFSYEGTSLHILAGGKIEIPGYILITAPDNLSTSITETVTLSNGTTVAINGNAKPTLDIRAGIDWTQFGGLPGNVGIGVTVPPSSFGASATSADIIINNVTIEPPNGLVFLTNQYIPNTSLKGDITATNTGFYGYGIDARGFGGNGSSVILDSRNNITLAGSTINSASDLGRGGDVTLLANQAILANGALVIANGQGGGNIQLQGNQLLFENSLIFSITLGAINGGDVHLRATDTVILDNAAIITSVDPQATGNGGNIAIAANELTVGGDGGVISTRTFGEGKAGDLTVETERLVLKDGGQLGADTFGAGDAGSLTVQASKSVEVSGTSTDGNYPSGLFTNSLSSDDPNAGNAGDLTINTGTLIVRDEAKISTETLGAGQGGNLTLIAPESVQLIRGELITRTSGSGNAGDLTIKTGQLIVNGGEATAFTFGQGKGGDLTVIASDFVELTGPGGLGSASIPFGDAGNVTIQTGRLIVREGAGITTEAIGLGKGGNIAVTASESVEVIGESSRLTTATRNISGKLAGDLTIRTGRLSVRDGGTVSVKATDDSGSAGKLDVQASELVEISGKSADGNASNLTAEASDNANAGEVRIATRRLDVRDGARVSAFTSGTGRAGNILIQDADLVSLDDGTISTEVRDHAVVNSKQKGNIDIQTRSLSLTNGSEVTASTSGVGDAGNIFVRNADSVFLDNSSISTQVNKGAVTQQPSNIDIQTRSLLLTNGSEVTANTIGQGDAGSIVVREAEKVSLFNSSISTESRSIGIAGDVTINTQQLTLQDNSQITASTVSSQGGGITLQGLDNLQVKDSLISASTETGTAGAVSVFATDSVQLRGTGGLSVGATAGGTAGDLTVNTNKMSVTDGAQVTVSSPQGQAGDLNITANTLNLNRGTLSAVTGTSNSEGGANINLKGLEFLRMDNESLISASALVNANGGNVTIKSTVILATPPTGLMGSDIIANADQGNGGRVDVTTDGLFGIQFRPQRTPKNDITVSSSFGLSGTYILTTPGIDPSRGLGELPSNVVDTSQQIDRRCTPKSTNQANSFVVTQRGGIPPNPNDTLQSESVVTPNWVTLDSRQENNTPPTPTTTRNSAPKQLVEAQGWSFNEQGQVILTATATNVTSHGSWQSPVQCPADAK
jgi:filamentous hemagglutinin family protein